LEVSPGKRKVRETLISTNKPHKVVHICNPSYEPDAGKRTAVQGQPHKKSTRPYLKNN
jgi:hypothetical protein